MSPNTPHILQNLEVPPPPGTWDTISTRLDAEYDVAETKIAYKLYDTEIAPPAAAWEHIALALTVTESNIATPAKVVRFPFYKAAIAAALLAVVSYLTWSFLGNSNNSVPQKDIVQSTTPANTGVDNTNDIPVQPSIPVIDASITGRKRAVISIARRAGTTPVAEASYIASNELPEEEPADIRYTGVNDMRAIAVTSRRGINAPLIRDASGKVVMDQGLITGGKEDYIVITCPNGEQTRISAKFLPMLNYMNGDADPAEYFDAIIRDNYLWKSRFREWRTKLLQQGSFIPTASNFFDIMELKDLLEDRP
jgi:hypothetical protein